MQQHVTPISDSEANEAFRDAYEQLDTEALDHVRGAHSILYSDETGKPVTDDQYVGAIRTHAVLAQRTISELAETMKAVEQQTEAREDIPGFYGPLDDVIGGLTACDNHLSELIAVAEDVQAGAVNRAGEIKKPGVVRSFDRATTALNALETILVDEFDHTRDDLQ